MMRRRDFTALLGGAAAWPLAAQAQPADDRVRALLFRILSLEAEGAALNISQFLKELESQIGWTTQVPSSVGTMEQRRTDALRLLRQVPAIIEIDMLDGTGKEQLHVSRLAMDVVGRNTDSSQDSKFTEAVAHKVYYGPVHVFPLFQSERCESRQSDVRQIDAIAGIGIYVRATNGQIQVVAPIDNTPAAKAGIIAGDIIVALDDEPVQGLALNRVVERMRGPVNTGIKLTVMRSGHATPIEFSIARDVIREGTHVSLSRCLPVGLPGSTRVVPRMTLSLAGARREAGVSSAEVNLMLVWDLIRQLKVGDHGSAYILDAQDRVLGHSDMFAPALHAPGHADDYVNFNLFQRDFSALAQVQAARAADVGPAEALVARDINGREVLSASASVAGPGWHVFVELPLAEADRAVP